MSNRTVLVVEDSEDEALILERGLRNSLPANSSVVCVSNTTAAEAYLFESPLTPKQNPDLVVLDVRVPPNGGVQFLRRLREDKRTRTIPVVMMSGRLGDADVEDLYVSGANSYLEKPVDVQAYVALISRTARYWLGLNLNTKQGR